MVYVWENGVTYSNSCHWDMTTFKFKTLGIVIGLVPYRDTMDKSNTHQENIIFLDFILEICYVLKINFELISKN
jgi:hypothetical protein